MWDLIVSVPDHCLSFYIVCNGKTPVDFVVQLCRQNNQSDNFKMFSSFESSIKAFDNIFENILSVKNIV